VTGSLDGPVRGDREGRRLSANEVRLAALALFHAVLLWGLFHRAPWARTVAGYLVNWPLAEAIALIVVPWLMMVAAHDHERPRWQRILWLPAVLLVMAGITRTIRLLRATWFYFVTCLPVVFARHSAADAQRGCLRSFLSVWLLLFLMVIFGDRAYRWPIGTIAGRWMEPEVREMANMMACAVVYFGIAAVVEVAVRRKLGKTVG